MSNITFTEDVELRPNRCWECGRRWAVEASHNSEATCPVCAKRKVAAADERAAAAERSMRAMRGAMARVKGKKGGARG